jgi:hypothetical protein
LRDVAVKIRNVGPLALGEGAVACVGPAGARAVGACDFRKSAFLACVVEALDAEVIGCDDAWMETENVDVLEIPHAAETDVGEVDSR